MIGKQSERQAGFALLMFLVVMMLVFGVAGFNFLGSKVKAVNQSKIEHDYEVLKKARQALLSYAVNYSTDDETADMGRLPCPDYLIGNSEGAQDGNCGRRHINQHGYLPWKTLGIEPLKDSNGECLWYVVSGDYKGSPRADMLNEDSNGLLQIQDENGNSYHGADPGNRPIAVIIAPGATIGGQVRGGVGTNCRADYVEANFLESAGGGLVYSNNHDLDGSGDDADKIWTYVYGSISSRLDAVNYNDKLIWITKNEYWDAVKAQNDLDAADPASAINTLTQEIAECLAAYANHGSNVNGANYRRWLPFPAQVDLIDYRDNNEYTDQAGRSAGRLPWDIDDSQAAASIDGGNDELFIQNTIVECAFNLNPSQQALWENWKDHFFYVVSQDFAINSATSIDLSTRCKTLGSCITVDGIDNQYAAMVFYADSIIAPQTRNTDNTTPLDPEEKNLISNYLEAHNAHDYTGITDNAYRSDVGDLAYCIRVDTSIVPPTTLIAEPC